MHCGSLFRVAMEVLGSPRAWVSTLPDVQIVSV